MKKILSHWNLPKVQTFVISILIGLYKMLIKNPFTGIWIVRKHELGFTSLTAEREWTDWVRGTFLKSSESYTSRNGTKWFYLSLSDLFFVCLCLSQPSESPSETEKWSAATRDLGVPSSETAARSALSSVTSLLTTLTSGSHVRGKKNTLNKNWTFFSNTIFLHAFRGCIYWLNCN